MKRLLFVGVTLLCMVACKTDLTDIQSQIDNIERQGATLDAKSKELAERGQKLSDALKQLKEETQELANRSESLETDSKAIGESQAALKEEASRLAESLKALQEEGLLLQKSLDSLETQNLDLVEEWNMLQQLIDEAQQELDRLEAELNAVEPKLLRMEFLATDNPMQLVENTECEIKDDVIVCRVLNVMDSKLLIPRLVFEGDYVTIGGREIISGKTEVDFSSPRVLTVYAGEKSRDYTVTVSSYTGLPTVWAEINGRQEIQEVNHYYKISFKLVDNTSTRADGSLSQVSARMLAHAPLREYERYLDFRSKTEMGKNAYSLLFNQSVSMLNESASTTWRLFPNVYDVTMLHNQTAFYMGKLSKLDYTPHFHYIDFMLNGQYFGTYMLGDDLDVSASRVNVGSNGFILNISSSPTGSYFTTSYIEQPISVLAPNTQTSEAVNYIINYVNEAESALFSPNFADSSAGWQRYLDIDSFVDWYLINEIAKNNSGAFQSNCIMNLKRGGKLKMGPLWDFERAFGNATNGSTSGFVIKNVNWYSRLFQDPAFVAKVKERFNYFYSHQGDIINEINSNAQYLKYAVQEDDNKWQTLESYKKSNSDTWEVYQSSVGSMKKWLAARMEWLKAQFDVMG